ncbi:hypothetical protein V2W45_190397 [Cenococcum geophilum]
MLSSRSRPEVLVPKSPHNIITSALEIWVTTTTTATARAFLMAASLWSTATNVTSAPADHMHIIECSDINEETILKSLRLADGIATVLYNWKKEALDAFLDPKITVELVIQNENSVY